jgi:hypothetical protein
MKSDVWHAIYIDGVEHLGQRERNTLYLDDPSLPARRCRAIQLDDSSWRWLLNRHGAVRTSGVSISMSALHEGIPDAALPVKKKARDVRIPLIRKILNVIKEHYK